MDYMMVRPSLTLSNKPTQVNNALQMFISAFVSFVAYTSIFLRLRGNIVIVGLRIRFRRVSRATAWQVHSERDAPNRQMVTIAKQMLLYPVRTSLAKVYLVFAMLRLGQCGRLRTPSLSSPSRHVGLLNGLGMKCPSQ